MLIRIVRMHFKESGVEEFLAVFNRHKAEIRNFEGCSHLELLKDVDASHTYITYSYWRDAAALERYRQSALFESVWGRTKGLFSDRPQAFSVEKFIDVPGTR
ncbi:MAG TPA: antibiotic biosynthesis monooxygenase family protein [Chryseolinea sp.]